MYNCRHCAKSLTFYNRCNMLSHIRSHSFKTATINVSDLRVDPLPRNFFNMKALSASNITVTSKSSPSSSSVENNQGDSKSVKCYECKEDIYCTGIVYKDRAKHYSAYTNNVHSCPVCMHALSTICGLKAHMRLHLKCPPYYCPECGVSLPNTSLIYPNNHDCEGFRMMRATARQKCPMPECSVFHPTDFKEHLKKKHLKKVFKCPLCFVACFTDSVIEKHLKTHDSDSTPLIFYQCQMCPGRLVLHNQIDNHLNGHAYENMYPCWACGLVSTNVPGLIEHHIQNHGLDINLFHNSYGLLKKATRKENETQISNGLLRNATDKENEKKKSKKIPRKIYRVVKRCDQCKRSFIYKCKLNQIKILPTECPYNCSGGLLSGGQQSTGTSVDAEITCHMCQNKIPQNWEEIKKHYAAHHNKHKCIDVQVIVSRMKIEKYTNKNPKVRRFDMKRKGSRNNRKRNKIPLIAMIDEKSIGVYTTQLNRTPKGQFACNKCGHECESKEQLETHLISHRDPYMAYQCMECGQSFVVKPSFATHLLLEHNISDVQSYINTKQCYNESALMKNQNISCTNEPLRENQCKICRDQFENSDDLEKHFRVHGMAFLMKNNSNKNSP